MKRKNRMGRKALSFLCIFALLITMIPATALAGQASDISNHWARTQIESMMDKGYFNGYQDGNFKPDQKITRAEFMAIINRAFNFTAKSEGSFTDVKPGAWYADVVSQAKAAGYISGYPDGSIRPDNTITRQEVAVIMARLNKLTDNASAAADFTDADRIPDWCKGAIGALVASGIMNGYTDGSFRAANSITRAEAAVLLYKALQYNAPPETPAVTPPAVSTGGSVSGSSGGGGHHSGGGSTYADMVLYDGVVYSVNGISKDTKETINDAVAVKDGKIIYVGSDSGVKSYIKSGTTQEIDLNGKMLLPGFSDSHAHAKAMASNIFDLSLYATPSPKGVIKALRDYIAENNPKYVMGNGWDTLQEEDMIKAHDDLNDATGDDIPVVLYDSSHHIAWANDTAIKMAGIDPGGKITPNPPGGVIVRDKDNKPTGIFHENSAIHMVLAGDPSGKNYDNEEWQYEIGLKAYQEMANSYGLTLNQDPEVSENAIAAYEKLANEGSLTMRFRGGYLSSPVIDDNDKSTFAAISAAADELDRFAKASAVKHTAGGDLFQMNFVKIYGDGGGPTTYMKENPTSANAVWPVDQLNYLCEQLEKNGVQIHCHSMGDAALSEFLDAFKNADGKTDVSGKTIDVTQSRNSITHLQYVDQSDDSDDAQRMADLGVIGIPQPFWMVKDPYYSMYWPYCGKERTAECYPMKSLIDKGVIMAGGSDWPVTQPNAPLTSIQIGMTRTLPYDDPAVAYTPDMQRNPMYRTALGAASEKADLKTMIQAVTINGAYAMFLENVTGSIEKGKSADMVVLDKDLRDVAKNHPEDIGKTNVMMTIFKGKIVYQASQPTVSDYSVVKYKSAPSAAYPDLPYSLVVANGTTAEDLIGALNAPVDGSLNLVYAVAGDTWVIGQAVSDDATVTDDMELIPTYQGAEQPPYSIAVDYPDIANAIAADADKTYAVDDDTFVITLATPVPGLTAEDYDIYLLGSDNISAQTLDIEDISKENGLDAGTMYEITAMDLTESLDLQPLSGTYSIYVYPPYVPQYIPYPDYVFTNNGKVKLTF